METSRPGKLGLAVLVVALAACAGTTTPTTALPATTSAPEPGLRPGGIAAAGALAVPRAAHTATRLRDGRVLVAGGCSRPGCGGNADAVAAELYDPATGAFTAGPAMTVPRAGHTATLLADGRVLILGGYQAERRPPLATAEFYEPAADRFVPAGELAKPRGSHTATALADGRVLIAGGTDGNDVLDIVEIYDPATGRFVPVAPLPEPRSGHGAVRLESGEVLAVGGHGPDEEAVPGTAVRYDPATDTWTDAGELGEARYKLALVALPDGGALAIGGSDPPDAEGRLRSIERWDPATGTWAKAAELSAARFKIEGAVAVLPDGRVLIAGDASRAEVFDPVTGSLEQVAGADLAPSMFATATTLADGRVLIAGGYDHDITPTAAAYLYAP